MNEYLIEYYNIEPNVGLEAVQLSDKSNRNKRKLSELDGYFMIHKVQLADIEDMIVPYNNAWWLYTKANSVKEAIDKFYDIFNTYEEKLTRTYYATANEIRQMMGLKVVNDPKAEMLIKKEPEKHCFSCKACDPYGHNVPDNHGYCFLNGNIVNFDDVACSDYIANK